MPETHIFTQARNQATNKTAKTAKATKSIPLTGYVSPTGKLVLPIKTLQAIGNLSGIQAIKVGSQADMRKLTILYLVPTDEQDAEGFAFTSTPRRLTIELAHIPTSGRVNYKTDKYSYILTPFAFQEVIVGYELQLTI